MVFEERGKAKNPEKKLTEHAQGREPTTKLNPATHGADRRSYLNPSHLGGREVLSALRHPSPAFLKREKSYSLGSYCGWS